MPLSLQRRGPTLDLGSLRTDRNVQALSRLVRSLREAGATLAA